MHQFLRSRFRNISPRDVMVILLGAVSMHLCSLFLFHVDGISVTNFKTHLFPQEPSATTVLDSWQSSNPPPQSPLPDLGYEIPETELVRHAPGWTIFRNLYMANGTLIIVTSNPESFPSIDLITSTGLPALNTPENIAERIPTDRDMAIIMPQEAQQRWGAQSMMDINNIFPVEGPTVRPLHCYSNPRSLLNPISSFSMIPASVSSIFLSSSHLTLTVAWKQSLIITTTSVRNFSSALGPFGMVTFGALLRLYLYSQPGLFSPMRRPRNGETHLG